LRFKARVLRDPLLGCELHGRYRIDRKLGQGGMGAVYQAHQLSVRRDVAVKIMRGEGGIDPTLVKRFFQEARAASQLTSRHTIKIIDFGETDDGIYYMAMELLKGQPLDAVLAEGPMDPERAIQIGRHVCLALKEAHGLGIIHRDLKPSNIFLEPSEEEPEIAKVLDFGIAKWQQAGVSQLTTVGSLYGTPSYMSPEQCQALPLDARSDLYALGVILYQLVAGRPPFDAPSSVLLVMAQVEDPPPPLAEVAPTVPSALARLIHRLLAKQPADRPGSAEELLAELDRVREALRARRPPSRPPLSLSLTAPASLSELQVTDRGGSGPAAIPSAALSGGEPAVRRRWPWVLLPALLIAGLGTGLAVWGSQRPSFLPPPPAPLAELFGSALAPAAPTPAAAPTPGSAGTSSAPASATPPPAGPGVAEAPDAAATPAPVGAEGPQPVGSPTVQIRLLSEPLGAFAIVGDVSVLETPARLKLLIADKPVQVRFRKPGYQDEVRTFTPDQDREVRVVLKAEKP
jgi:serine/threonine-protein kinase